MTRKRKMHDGVDIKVRTNTPVRSTGSGRVIRSGWENARDKKQGFGRRITIDHGNGNTSTYGHLNSLRVKKPDKVNRGQVIGRSGSSGASTAPHLHYEERYKGKSHRPTNDPGSYRPRRRPRR